MPWQAGNIGRPPRPLEERLWSKVDASGDCWLWTAHVADGYGYIRDGTKTCRVHRVVWELLVGPIPDGMQLDHLCRVRRCVNPDHLEPVTGRENRLRSPIHWSGVLARKTHCKRGHEFTAENTYVEKRGTRNCRTCQRDKMRQRRAAA